jgi:hypothetical protein
MPWFPVDDSFHSHPKQMAASLAAIGLWSVAGSWSSKHLTDGFVPDHMVSSLSRGQVELAKELVTAGLWTRTRGGYRFHQWHADNDGSPRNQTRSEAIAKRSKMSSGGTLGNHRRWHVDKGRTDPKCAFCLGERDRPPSRVPDQGGESGGESGANPPVPSQSPKGTREGKGSQSSSRHNARDDGPDDDDSIDLATVELLAELTGQDVGIAHAAATRRRILGGRTIRTSRRGYVLAAIRDNPGKFLPGIAVDPEQPTRLRVVPDRKPWCGSCHSDDYRWLEIPGNGWDKCPACNPTAPPTYPHETQDPWQEAAP